MADAGVYSRNLFDLLDEENQEPKAQTATAAGAKDAKKKKEEAAPAAAPAKKDDTRARPEQNKIRTGYPGRGGAASNRGARAAGEGSGNGPVAKDRNVPPRLARQGGEGGEGAPDVTEAKEERAARRDRSERSRGEYRGRGRGVGGARGGFGGRPPRHEYDRHSNIEHPESDKKEVAGKGNWGGIAAETEATGEKVEVEGEAKEETPAEPTPEELERKAAEEERRRQEEEDAKLMTLEQYQAAQAAKRTAAAAAAPARKANEGVDESQWKTKKFERKEDDEVYFAGKGTAKPTKEKPKKVKETIELDMRFSDETTRRPSTRGRGGESRGGRGGGVRGRGREGAGASGSVTLEDPNAFPSLTKA